MRAPSEITQGIRQKMEELAPLEATLWDEQYKRQVYYVMREIQRKQDVKYGSLTYEGAIYVVRIK